MVYVNRILLNWEKARDGPPLWLNLTSYYEDLLMMKREQKNRSTWLGDQFGCGHSTKGDSEISGDENE